MYATKIATDKLPENTRTQVRFLCYNSREALDANQQTFTENGREWEASSESR